MPATRPSGTRPADTTPEAAGRATTSRRPSSAAGTVADPLAPFRLDGRVVLLTGASSGLGEVFARALSAAGARLVVAARRAELLERLAAELSDTRAVRCDLASPADRARLVDAALAEHGRVDVLVNNAGTAQSAPAVEESAAAVQRTLQVDLVAPFDLATRVAPGMLAAGRGSIVHISSVAGLRANDRYPLASYAAAKSGLHGLTRDLAAQWGRHGVRVNTIAPGWFPTRMNGFLEDPDQHAWVAAHTALGRPGRLAEAASALIFLASDASSYVTGQVLAVDGGWTAY